MDVLGAAKLGDLAKQLARLSGAARRVDLGGMARGATATSRASGAASGKIRTLAQEMARLARSDAQRKVTREARELLNGVSGTPRVVTQLRTVEGEMARLKRLSANRAITAEARKRLGDGPSMLTGHGFVSRGRQTLGLMRDMAVAGLGMRYAFQAVGSGVSAAITPMMNFEKSMAEIRTKGSFSAAQTAAIAKTAKGIGTQKGSLFGAGEAAQAGIELAASGLSPDAIAAQLPTVLQFAQAGDIDATTGAITLVETMAQFGKTAADFENIGDVMVKAANMSTISVGDMTETLKYVGPVAKSAGIEFEQVSAMIALLGERGIKGSMAGTSMRKVITSLVQPTRMARKALAEVGMSAGDARKGMEDLPGFLQKLDAAMQRRGFSQARRLSVTKRLFGQEGLAAVETLMKTMTERTADGSTAWDKYKEGIAGAGGSMRDTAAIMGNTLEGKMRNLRASVESAQIALGEGLAPVLTELIPKLAGAAVETGKWLQENQGLVGAIAEKAPLAIGGMLSLNVLSSSMGAITSFSGALGVKLGMGAGAAFGTSMLGFALPVIAAGIAGYGFGSILAEALGTGRMGADLADKMAGRDPLHRQNARSIHEQSGGRVYANPLHEVLKDEAAKRAPQKEDLGGDPILQGIAESSKGVPAALAPAGEMKGFIRIEIDQTGRATVANLEKEGMIDLEVGSAVGP